MRDFIDITRLATILCVSSKTLRNKYADPHKAKQLPPRVVIPGIDRLLFDVRDVEAWQNSLQRAYGAIPAIVYEVGNTPVPLSTDTQPKRRGRPTNLERHARGVLQ